MVGCINTFRNHADVDASAYEPFGMYLRFSQETTNQIASMLHEAYPTYEQYLRPRDGHGITLIRCADMTRIMQEQQVGVTAFFEALRSLPRDSIWTPPLPPFMSTSKHGKTHIGVNLQPTEEYLLYIKQIQTALAGVGLFATFSDKPHITLGTFRDNTPREVSKKIKAKVYSSVTKGSLFRPKCSHLQVGAGYVKPHPLFLQMLERS